MLRGRPAMLAGYDGEDELSPFWDPADPPSSEDLPCGCPPPPPPRFLVPPPPASCGGGAGAAHFCQMEPVGAEFTQTAFPSLPIIAVCSSVVLVAVLVASFLLWKHKRKVQNFLPCKTNHQGRCDMGGSAGITYDDVLINHHPTRLPNHLNPDTNTLTPIELLDVKYGNYVPSHTDSLTRANFVLPAVTNNTGQQQNPPSVERSRQHQHSHHRSNRHHSSKKKDHQFHPIYEEVSATSDDNKPGGRSLDSDIEDSEVEGRTVASEDEFAEDELSVAGEYPINPEEQSQQCSATSSLQGSTGGDLYPDGVTGSSGERFCSDGSPLDTRAVKNSFRGLDVTSAHNKLTHSLERNKDGHPSNSFQAKQNYYLNKSMLGPDFTYPEGMTDGSSCVSPSGDIGQSDSCQYPNSRAMGSSLNFIPALLQQQQQQQQQRSMPLSSRSASNSPPPPPYPSSTNPRQGSQNSSTSSGVIPALYNPQIVSPNSQQLGRIPDALLRELSFKLPTNSGVATMPAIAPMSSRSLPVPPSCRGSGGSGVLFTVENPYPPQVPLPSISRTRSGSATEFTSTGGRGGSLTYHPYPHHALSGGRPPTPPPPENIYASIDDVGPFTIDGSRHRSPFGRKGSTDLRNTFGRSTTGRSSKSSTGDKFQSNNVPNRHPNEEGGSYGDIRPIYDSRTACS